MEVITKPFSITASQRDRNSSTTKKIFWDRHQLVKYAVFLEYCMGTDSTTTASDCQSWSFFRRLSIFIQTKNPNQCRLHHKKMMKHHSSIPSLLSSLKKANPKFEDLYLAHQRALKNLTNCIQRQRDEIEKSIMKEDQKENSIHGSPETLSYDKKNDDMISTGISYRDEPEPNIKPSNFVPYKSVIKQSQILFNMEDDQADLNEELASLSKLSAPNCPTSISYEGKKEAQWSDCHFKFLDYFGMLNSLRQNSAV